MNEYQLAIIELALKKALQNWEIIKSELPENDNLKRKDIQKVLERIQEMTKN